MLQIFTLSETTSGPGVGGRLTNSTQAVLGKRAIYPVDYGQQQLLNFKRINYKTNLYRHYLSNQSFLNYEKESLA